MNFREITLAEQQLWLLPGGAVFLPETATLVVADLHLGKGTSARSRGLLLPPGDTVATLEKLSKLLDMYAPQRLIALGDSFHDGQAGDRLLDAEKTRLEAITRATPTIWIAGNHDVLPVSGLTGTWVEELQLSNLILRHIPSLCVSDGKGELAGHLHPKVRMRIKGHTITRPCFITGTDRLILPAFGAYTGGLSISDPAFVRLFPQGSTVYVWGAEQIHRVA
ncbi:ligase-associated DNA damage response endonuclease PdeM [Acetobacter persici]|uniref:ligase-associated DNA damage response endonuclease PdeM n=1 Tax=Acetobacter persici TaxID=1076596 RepID=UPI0039EB7AD2